MKNNNRGFLLVEVLVALVILAVGLTVGIEALIFCVRMNNLAYRRSTVALLADNNLSILLLPQGSLPQDGSKGQLEDNYNWEIKIEEVNKNLDKIIYTTSWKERNTIQRIELTTYRAKAGTEKK
ncbi:MAG: prepilin-type N-terminal cleavage/methylation domain-containing protein [bacterium]